MILRICFSFVRTIDQQYLVVNCRYGDHKLCFLKVARLGPGVVRPGFLCLRVRWVFVCVLCWLLGVLAF